MDMVVVRDPVAFMEARRSPSYMILKGSYYVGTIVLYLLGEKKDL